MACNPGFHGLVSRRRQVVAPNTQPSPIKNKSIAMGSKAKKSNAPIEVAALKHAEAKRRNIPTAEYQALLQEEEKRPIRVAIARRDPDLDPQLVWRGKDAQDWSQLVVNAPPLYIQEKISPKVLIDDLRRETAQREHDSGAHLADLFADFNGLPKDVNKTEFYRHEQNWSNRMILGDSLQVMASLAEREGLRGKVQCIYLDPPYGIKFNSNFQWSTTSREVKDGKLDQITREPEQVKAFRDTWRDGIHSYLTYLRDRLTVARDLLTESGSIFVQIGDENVHRVRALMDEVFGEENFVSSISFVKTTGFSSSYLSNISDFVLWYARDSEKLKYRELYLQKEAGESGAVAYRDLSEFPVDDYLGTALPTARLATSDQLTSQGAPSDKVDQVVRYRGREFLPPKGLHWKTTPAGVRRLSNAGRIFLVGNTLRYLRYLSDYPVYPLNNSWGDTGIAGFASDKVYVVQTLAKVIERCVLMSTDPGDLVLDPTCGSGTTAYVAEQWGRRWITIDTSRVALALARARIMGALSVLPLGRFARRQIERGGNHGRRAFVTSDARRYPPRLRVRTRAAHHAEIHRQQRRDRCDLGEVAEGAGSVAASIEQDVGHVLGRMANSSRSHRRHSGESRNPEQETTGPRLAPG
jgi:adenine-specific DNA-methyltransferase